MHTCTRTRTHTLTHMRSQVLPGPWAVLLMAMLVIVCGIQWLWFYKIVRLATGAEAPPKRQKKVL